MNIKINKKDDIVLKILHYFITEEEYKPVVINGLENEIWLENMEKDLQLIRINTNYIHNEEQFKTDTYKAKTIMKSIKKNTLTINMNMLNLLLDTSEYIDSIDINNNKNIETIKINNLSDFKKNKVVSEFFPNVKDAILNDKMDTNDFFKLTNDMNEKTIKNEKKLQKIFSIKKPTVTYALICINIVLFLISELVDVNDIFTSFFYNNYILVQRGQIFRLFTCMFMHGNIIHLACNMYALYCIGPQIERYYGKTKYLFIYFLSGILGSIFSCVFMSSNTYSFGASGAIFGLLGSLAYFTYYYRATLQGLLRSSVVPSIVINLLIGLFIPGIDLMAHIGGLIGGILISMGLGIGDKGRKSDQTNGIIVLALMYAFMLYMLFTK